MRPSSRKPAPKPGLHPRNRHAGGYDFPGLIAASPGLERFVLRAFHGGPSIDFSNAEAVVALNRALLASAYGIQGWDLPPGFLCPPIPGRADYIHHLADLLEHDHAGVIPHGAAVRGLDIGTGASVIYPLIGHREYGWTFVGTDLDETALTSASRILGANPWLAGAIVLRRQTDRRAVFSGIVEPSERFDLTLCNPPFHGSLREAREAAENKWRKLGRGQGRTTRNFGGQGAELWCEGGEEGFILRMVAESVILRDRVRWFTTLVSRAATLPAVTRALRKLEVRDLRTIPMAQGQKQSRFVAWSFLDSQARRAFRP